MIKLFILLFYLLFCNILLFILLESFATYRNDMYCISLIIPSTNNTWNMCKKQIENMICKSIETPKEVIIVISNCVRNHKETYNTYCKYKLYLYYRKNIKNAASNKNYGGELSKCNIISYFDSDDIMSSYRIKMLHNVMQYYSEYDIVLHMYTKNYNSFKQSTIDLSNIPKYIYSNSSYLTSLYKRIVKTRNVRLWGCYNFIPRLYHISNGWITIRRELFEKEKFNEDISIQRAEDSEYNGRVISKGYRALYILLELGFYSRQNQCFS